MHLNDEHVLARTRRYVVERLTPAINQSVAELHTGQWAPPVPAGETVNQPVPRAEGLGAEYSPIQPYTPWGPAWGTTWFHVTGDVPASHQHLPLEIDIDLGFSSVRAGFQAEGLSLTPVGETIKGIHPRNHWIPVDARTTTGGTIDVYIEAASNPNLGFREHPYSPSHLGETHTAGTDPIYIFRGARLVHRHPEVAGLTRELTALLELAEQLPADAQRRWEIIVALHQSLIEIDLGDIPGTAAQARERLAPALSRPATGSALELTAIGHAHLDTAWLWPMRETRRKAVRTIANAIHLADTRDDVLFTLSAAQHAAWVAEDDPDLFERLREHVRGGSIVPVGGMWIEPDANLPGGEALVRQFTSGVRYFRDVMGHRARELWLPDSFGYSAALPQLARLAGMRWFLTQKLSWNNENQFPHHSLWWEGIDGSKLFTHFPTADTYCAELTGGELAHAERNFRDKGHTNKALLPFGYGDGGGGPTREMHETWATVADLEGSPRLIRQSPEEFFTQAEEAYPEAPVWVGELYLEKHRGAATSQAQIKAGNRRNEALLAEAELWATTATVRRGAPYPAEELAECWRILMVNQFHDILPGTSIAWAHQDAIAQHADLTERLERLIEDALSALGTRPGSGLLADPSPLGTLGITAEAPTHAEPTTLDGATLSNGLLRVTFDDDGLIASLVDLAAGRELIPEGQRGGLLQLHHDFPAEWDAWDIDEAAHHNPQDLSEGRGLTFRTEEGAGVVEVERSFGASTLTQRYELAPGAGALKVTVDLEWKERDKLLKLAFPFDVHCTDADFEIQFGHLSRPTHRNTPWDAARFEVAAHRWLHLDEAGYGVGLANSRTYGWDLSRHTQPAGPSWTMVRASLIKGGRFPDPNADEGRHSFSFLITPGAGLLEARRAGYELNQPARRRAGDPVEPLVHTDGTVIVETVKLADDGSGDVVLRAFEPVGRRTRASIQLGFTAGTVTETDLLEEDALDSQIPRALRGHGGNVIELDLRPFQVVTLRVSVNNAGDGEQVARVMQ